MTAGKRCTERERKESRECMAYVAVDGCPGPPRDPRDFFFFATGKPRILGHPDMATRRRLLAVSANLKNLSVSFQLNGNDGWNQWNRRFFSLSLSRMVGSKQR